MTILSTGYRNGRLGFASDCDFVFNFSNYEMGIFFVSVLREFSDYRPGEGAVLCCELRGNRTLVAGDDDYSNELYEKLF